MIADMIFKNGEIHTVDPDNQVVTCIAIKDDRILAVGEAACVACQGKGTKVIDLKGKSLLPGFIDAHLHMAVLGMNMLSIDCRYPQVRSIEDIKLRIREKAESLPEGTWIRGWGYDHTKLAEKRHPTRWDLDEATTKHPVILTRACSHISVHNSNSLQLAGIDDSTPSPEGGVIEKEDGHVSGVMKENAHMNILSIAAPSKEELKNALLTADQLLISQGITGIHDSGGYGPIQMEVMEEMEINQQLKTERYNMIFSFHNNIDFVNSYIKKGSHQKTALHLGPVKIMIDGSSSGPTAATLKPYTSDSGNYGIMSMGQQEIDDIILRAHLADFQVTSHAVGDRAVTAIVDAIERALAVRPKENHRHRIEHCAMINDTLLKRIKKLGIIPILQPIFFYEFGDGYLKNYGDDRVEIMFACKTFFDNNILCAGSSDCPITFSDPLMGMHLAVNRVTQTGTKISQSQRITKQQALRMYTYNSAYAAFEEKEKGSLETGKKANIVILNDSLLNCPDAEIRNLRVEATMIDGEFVYQEKTP